MESQHPLIFLLPSPVFFIRITPKKISVVLRILQEFQHLQIHVPSPKNKLKRRPLQNTSLYIGQMHRLHQFQVFLSVQRASSHHLMVDSRYLTRGTCKSPHLCCSRIINNRALFLYLWKFSRVDQRKTANPHINSGPNRSSPLDFSLFLGAASAALNPKRNQIVAHPRTSEIRWV
jgi:hypothetical protein